jgi:hypothetical protein
MLLCMYGLLIKVIYNKVFSVSFSHYFLSNFVWRETEICSLFVVTFRHMYAMWSMNVYRRAIVMCILKFRQCFELEMKLFDLTVVLLCNMCVLVVIIISYEMASVYIN